MKKVPKVGPLKDLLKLKLLTLESINLFPLGNPRITDKVLTGIVLNKQMFQDAICLRYNFALKPVARTHVSVVSHFALVTLVCSRRVLSSAPQEVPGTA